MIISYPKNPYLQRIWFFGKIFNISTNNIISVQAVKLLEGKWRLNFVSANLSLKLLIVDLLSVIFFFYCAGELSRAAIVGGVSRTFENGRNGLVRFIRTFGNWWGITLSRTELGRRKFSPKKTKLILQIRNWSEFLAVFNRQSKKLKSKNRQISIIFISIDFIV